MRQIIFVKEGRGKIIKFQTGSAAVLLAAAAFYFVPMELLTGYILACLFHELCHLAAMKVCKVEIHSFRIELTGLVIEHGKMKSPVTELISVLSGPAGGLVFAFACSRVSTVTEIRWLEICAAFSLILSIFNLLPCLPLDGGRAVNCLLQLIADERDADKISRALSYLAALILAACGFLTWSKGYGCGTAIAGCCLLFFNLFEEGIVKRGILR